LVIEVITKWFYFYDDKGIIKVERHKSVQKWEKKHPEPKNYRYSFLNMKGASLHPPQGRQMPSFLLCVARREAVQADSPWRW
jgi:hypothetical protein